MLIPDSRIREDYLLSHVNFTYATREQCRQIQAKTLGEISRIRMAQYVCYLSVIMIGNGILTVQFEYLLKASFRLFRPVHFHVADTEV